MQLQVEMLHLLLSAAKQLNNNSSYQSKAIGLAADVRNLDSQKQAVKEVLKTFNQLDFVIANAGLGHFGSIEDIYFRAME